MANDLVNKTEKDFESIKHMDENGTEFWYARELMVMLEYSKWGNFKNVIKYINLARAFRNLTVNCNNKNIKKNKNSQKVLKEFKKYDINIRNKIIQMYEKFVHFDKGDEVIISSNLY